MNLDVTFSESDHDFPVGFSGSNHKIGPVGFSGSNLMVGADGATFVPSVSNDGIISWTNDKDLPNPEPVNIKGAKGDIGLSGKDGQPGKDGADGYSPVRGVDYYTEADKAEMVSAVISALPKYNGEVVDV